jgi:hypothetical protein
MAKTLMMISLMLLFPLAMFGCHDKDRDAVAEVQKLIQQNLKPGDSQAKIEAFFKENKLPYDFDRFNQLYLSGIPSSRKTDSKGVESVITIKIYVNQDRSFQKADVRMSYTYL